MNTTIEINPSLLSLEPPQIDNLASEFYGRVLLDNSESAAIEFPDREHANKFCAALKSFTI